MDLFIGIMLALGVGFATAAQGPTNAALGSHVGAVQASMVSFAGGFVILLVVCLVTGWFDPATVLTADPWKCLAGVYGAFIVFSMAYCTSSLGAALTLTLMMLGQLLGGTAIDALGLLETVQIPMTAPRLLGCVLALAGIVLVYLGRKRQESFDAAQGASATSAVRNPKGELPGESLKQAKPLTRGRVSWGKVVLSFASGLASAIQTPTHAAMAAIAGTLGASTLNFTVGLALLTVATLITTRGRLASLRDIAPWKFTGGVYGAFGVFALATATPLLGVGLVLCVMMVAQLVGAVLVDQFGWLGVKQIRVDRLRVIGTVVMAVGAILVTLSKLI